MRRFTSIAGAALVGVLASTASAQTGVLYRLQPGSTLFVEYCLPPCACPSHSATGPISGLFTLTRTAIGPLFDEFTVTGVDWVSPVVVPPITLAGDGTYRLGGEVAVTHQMTLSLSVSTASGNPLVFDSGLVGIDPNNPFPKIGITIESPVDVCTRYTVHLIAAPLPCQADCDGSGGLNANDFQCFLNKFAIRDPYANCDGSATPPVLNANDFQCYLNRFAAGCP